MTHYPLVLPTKSEFYHLRPSEIHHNLTHGNPMRSLIALIDPDRTPTDRPILLQPGGTLHLTAGNTPIPLCLTTGQVTEIVFNVGYDV